MDGSLRGGRRRRRKEGGRRIDAFCVFWVGSSLSERETRFDSDGLDVDASRLF